MSARGRAWLMVPVLLLPAAVQAKSIDDCERFKAPLAYNQCLAEFSPARRHHAGTAPPQAMPQGEGEVVPVVRAGRHQRRVNAAPPATSPIRRTGGRSIATFEIGSSGRAFQGHARRR